MTVSRFPRSQVIESPSTIAATMRVAIAGTGGLAFLIAYYLHAETEHDFIFLSRAPKPALTQRGWQIIVVDYNDRVSLDFALTGIDVVISTVPGTIQINIIDAAIRVRVRRFAPAEFEGRPLLRPVDALDRGKAAVLAYLQQHENSIEFTVFVCGILYERFGPGGLYASNIGLGSGLPGEGDYMMNLRYMTAKIPFSNAAGQHVTLCMTAAQEVGRFIARAISLPQWPQELLMCGERVTTLHLVTIAQTARGRTFQPDSIVWHDSQSLATELLAATVDPLQVTRILSLIATLEGRYDFVQPNLNAALPAIRPLSFQAWLLHAWAGQ